jgi:ABC-type multidrug transport system ATPase subunit/TM2 domain-containing membrane protein YozV
MKAQRSMGLCPQFDTLIGQLSVKENLTFFGRVKGVPLVALPEVVDAFMVALNIKQYENKLTQRLSGGNRRKVSLAVALIGCPPTVYLDEPSTGLDPVASRLMWRLLIRLASRKQNAIVLTTHNMLECEAVCSRICMMKAGELVCLGDSQHLRNIHGTGFLLEIVLKDISGERCERAKLFVIESFEGAVIVDEHALMLNFEIPREAIPSLSQAFRLLESRKIEIGIANYSLSQSSLEQVFLKQIRPKNDEEDVPKIPSMEPNITDYFVCFICICFSVFFPGLHHFKLGNFWLGLEYFFTYNHILVGSIFDLLEMFVLVKRSVQQQNVHLTTCLCHCPCCSCSPCCAPNEVDGEPSNGCCRAQTRAIDKGEPGMFASAQMEYIDSTYSPPTAYAQPVNPMRSNTTVPFSNGGASSQV